MCVDLCVLHNNILAIKDAEQTADGAEKMPAYGAPHPTKGNEYRPPLSCRIGMTLNLHTLWQVYWATSLSVTLTGWG